MRSLTTQKELREARDPGFCYLCGQAWEEKDKGRGKRDRDHVPPQAIFGEEHRTPPLVLRTHPKCNNGQSEYDQQIAQLLSLVRKERPTPRDVNTLRVSMHEIEGMAPFGAVEHLPLGIIIARWLRGFHAALYHEYLPQVEGRIHEPFPGGDEPGQDTTLHRARPILTAAIKANRTARNLDTIVAFGDQCRYECVWTPQDSGRPICIFALDIPAWRLLADPRFPRRSCVGWYRAPPRDPVRGVNCNPTGLPHRGLGPPHRVLRAGQPAARGGILGSDGGEEDEARCGPAWRAGHEPVHLHPGLAPTTSTSSLAARYAHAPVAQLE